MELQNEKQKTLMQFYSLRAGLSAISECSDRIKGYRGDIKTNKTKIENLKKVIADKNNSLERSNRRLIQAQTDRTECLNSIKQLKDEIVSSKESLNSSYKTYIAFTIFFVFGIVATVSFCGLLVWFFLESCSPNGSPLSFIMMPVAIVLIIISVIKSKKLFKERKSKRSSVYDCKRSIRNKTNEIEQLNNKLCDPASTVSEAYIDTLNSEIDTEKEEYAELQNELELLEVSVQKENEQTEDLISTQAQKAKTIHDGLISAYKDSVSSSDWTNTDLVIFYIESGRADTLKEALQLADKQRQTDQIVKAIGQASNAVCRSILVGAYALGGVIESSFKQLSTQINNQLSIGFGEMAMNLQEQTGQIVNAAKGQQEAAKQLISAVDLNNSLQNKANVTSEELLNDLRYNQRFWIK